MLVLTLLILPGLALSVWYEMVVDQAPPTKADRVFSTFVATYFPVGAPGIFFAAILAATMSSMTSRINSLVGCLTMDFVGRWKPNDAHRKKWSFARRASVMIGMLAGTVAGWFVAFSSASRLWVAPTATWVAIRLVALSIARYHFNLSAQLNS